jgi:molecular chaperone DnaJ
MITSPCLDCRGTGKVQESGEVPVEVPAGVDSGMRLRLRGLGESGEPGAPAGDLYVFVEVQKHKFFERDGLDLHCQVPVTFAQAALGSEMEIPTLDGKVTVQIPKGTQHGDVHRLRGKGMPDPRGGSGRGHLMVHFAVEVPKKLTKRQEELLRELAELDKVHVSPEQKSFLERIREYFAPEENQEA